jgi:hypothetical protein
VNDGDTSIREQGGRGKKHAGIDTATKDYTHTEKRWEQIFENRAFQSPIHVSVALTAT